MQTRRNSLDISKGLFQSGTWEFDPCVVSQTFAQLEIVSVLWEKTLHFAGFLRVSN
jgi:hypothetical protein